jgi:hypothetical protein
MDWLTWFPSIHWQRALFGLALIVFIIAVLMAVRPRSRKRRKAA